MNAKPEAAEVMIQIFAMRADFVAPSMSPDFSLPSICAANTMAGMPNGRQQNSVVKIERARYVPPLSGGFGAAGSFGVGVTDSLMWHEMYRGPAV